ncbi:hypothetical protein Trydic_g8164 [Trypoxylus dichotomus]
MKYGVQNGFNISVLVLGGAIPITIIFVSLTLALSKERYIISRKRFEERLLTKCLAVMIAATFLFWFPRILLIFWIPYIKTRIPKALAIMAPLGGLRRYIFLMLILKRTTNRNTHSVPNMKAGLNLAECIFLFIKAATIIPVLTYLVYLPTLRNALIAILAKKG